MAVDTVGRAAAKGFGVGFIRWPRTRLQTKENPIGLELKVFRQLTFLRASSSASRPRILAVTFLSAMLSHLQSVVSVIAAINIHAF